MVSSASRIAKAGRLALPLVAGFAVGAAALAPLSAGAQGRVPARTAQSDNAQPPAGNAPSTSAPAPNPPNTQPPSTPAPAAAPPNAQSAGNGALPPAPRELTPAEVSALQSAMTDRASGAVLTPGNVGLVRNRVIDAQSAANVPGYSDEAPPKVRPKLMTVQPQVDMASPQVVHLAFGMVTPITILDAQGKPWPITASAYDPRSFAVDGGGCGGQAVPPAERPTTIHVMPCRVSTYGNISISLENYPLPIVVIVKSGGRGVEAVDLPVTIEVRGRSAPSTPGQPPRTTAGTEAPGDSGPGFFPKLLEGAGIGAKHTALQIDPAAQQAAAPEAPVAYTSARTGKKGGKRVKMAGGYEPDRLLDNFGSGTAPRGALPVAADDPSVKAWSYGGRLYLRGPVIVVNPVQDAMAELPDGQRVWRFDRPVPRLLVTDSAGRERAVNLEY